MYKCDHCPYKTSVKCNFLRHLNRKKKCYTICENFHDNCQNFHAVCQNFHAVCENFHDDTDERSPEDNHDQFECITNKFECNKCKKVLSSKRNLKHHLVKCSGVSKLQCDICKKVFSSTKSKWNHKRNVICYPPTQSSEQYDLCEIKQCSTINNLNHCNVTNNIVNNNNNTYNITLNPFGSEDLWKIMQDEDVSEKIKWNLLNDDKYTIARAVPDVFFNDKYPENKTIKKLVKNDGMVEVHTGNNQWETRLTKDTVSTIGKKINSILEYVVQNSSFSERDRRKLFKFGEYSSYFEFLDVIGDIEDKVGKEYDDPPENEKRRFQRELGKLIGDIIYKESVKII